jgi:iron complex outermembrane recepter protein
MSRVVILILVSLYCSFIPGYGQVNDTLLKNKELEPIEIIAWFNQQPTLGLTASAQSISVNKIETQHTVTLLPALNTIAGVRMEERSPGSYRIAMRGSLIRSPFGIRNIKMYIDEFPLTDAGGNTYLNVLDPASVSAIHILKGPDGSIYGASSGGVIRIQPKGFNILQNQGSLLLSAGSFGLLQEQFSLQRMINDKYSFSVDQSFTRSKGYRENSALNKKTIQTAHKWEYSPKNQLRILVLYTDVKYRTPGGLTETQLDENPAMARPASASIPSATEQKTGVRNKTFFGGIAHEAALSDKFSHTVSIFGSYTDFENSFFTNYEIRKEKNLGLRTWVSYKDTLNHQFPIQLYLGYEGQKGFYRIDNYDNEQGVPTLPQALDDLNNTLSSFFYRAVIKLYQRWTIEASVGLNHAAIYYDKRYPKIANPQGDIRFGNIWMPRIAASCVLVKGIAVRGSASKGYSLPAIAEVRSSDNIINTDLEAETGINYETGIRWENTGGRFIADLSLYNYNISNGIIRQLRENGAEYYVNAGEIKQKGLEIFVSAYLLPFRDDRFIRTLSLQSALTYNNYRFGRYSVNNENFSDNKVTSVPDYVWSSSLIITFHKQTGLNISHNYTSSMPLNDANTALSDKFHLVQLKGNWNIKVSRSAQLQFFAGVDNLLNERYSLGNDINAFGNRFFNPAPPRNYYGGLKVLF